jgi:hypothetical protein
MTKRSVSFLAMIAVGVGLVGSLVTGCNLGSGGTVGVEDDTSDSDPGVESVVPASQDELSGGDTY